LGGPRNILRGQEILSQRLQNAAGKLRHQDAQSTNGKTRVWKSPLVLHVLIEVSCLVSKKTKKGGFQIPQKTELR